MIKQTSVQIPFSGTYESLWSDRIDREEEWLPTVTLDNASLKTVEEQLESLLQVDVPRYVYEGYMAELMDEPPPEELELSPLYTKSGQFETLYIPAIEA